jgi:hypothetical protein
MVMGFCLCFLGIALGGEPATVEQARAVFDLSKLTVPEGMEIGQATVSQFVANGKGKVGAVADGIIDQLVKMGCKESKEESGASRTDSYVNLGMEKEGFRLYLSASQSGDSVFVTVNSLGNIDVSTLPAPAGAKTIFKNVGTLMFTTEKSVADTASDVDAVLNKAGWRRAHDIDGSAPAEDEFRQWEYFQKGITLSVYVSTAPAQGNKTSVQYGSSLMDNDFLVPEDVRSMALSDYPDIEFRATSSKSLDQAIDFYLAELPKVGWKQRADRGFRKQEGTKLVFVRPERALTVRLVEKDGKTQIHGEEIPPSILDPKKEEPKAEMKKEELPVIEVMIPKGASDLTVDPKQEEFKYKTKTGVKDLAKNYAKALNAEGWKEDKRRGVLSEFGGSVEFEKGDQSVTLTFFKDVFAGVTEVTVTGYRCQVKPADNE